MKLAVKYFPETDPGAGATGNPEQGSDGTPSGGEKPERQEPQTIPYARFKEEIARRKKLEEQLKAIQEEQERRKREEMEKQGEYKKLAEEYEAKLKQLEPEAQAWREYQTQRREQLLAQLPEEDREAFGDLPLPKLERLVEKLKAAIPDNQPPPAGDQKRPAARKLPSEFGGYTSLEEFARKDPLGYLKARKEGKI